MTASSRCDSCSLFKTKGQPDPCLGELPGVDSACCGHGETEGYIKFENGRVVKFQNCRVEKTYNNAGATDSMFAAREIKKRY